MHHLVRMESLAPRRGVNRTTAIALLSSLAVFSTIVFFGAAYAMLPDPSPTTGLRDQAEPSPGGTVPALESPDGTEAVAVRGVASQLADDEAQERSDAVAEGAPLAEPEEGRASRPVRGQGRQANDARTPASNDAERGRGNIAACSSSDPLCGVDFGDSLDV